MTNRTRIAVKIVAWTGGAILTLLLAGLLLQIAASERVEVVELRTFESDGSTVATRLWTVDHDGHAWLRVGKSGSGWYSRLVAHPQVTVVRQGIEGDYLAVPRPEKSATINRLMQEKYTWGDTLIGTMLGSRDGSTPIELIPRQ